MNTDRRALGFGGKLLAGAISALLCFVLLAVVRADTIRLVPGSSVKAVGGQLQGQVTSETPTEVKIKVGGGEQIVPVDQIESVSYDGASPSYTLAESRRNAGLDAEAAELFQKAVAESKGKALLERAAQFGRAETLAGLALVDPSKSAEAVAALEPLTKGGTGGRQLGPALLLLIRLHLAAGDTEAASAALADLTARVPWAAGRAGVLKAKIQGRKGEHDAALAELDALIAASPKDSSAAREAMLAKAESLAATKKFAEAEATVRSVIEQAGAEDAAIQAEAYNTLGDCLRAAGRPKDALRAYLRTDILYSSAKDEHARALANIVEIWRELKQDARAADVLEQLKQQYPQSPYLKAKTPAA
jgi:tetratricopeptide (TPR) repeat protein